MEDSFEKGDRRVRALKLLQGGAPFESHLTCAWHKVLAITIGDARVYCDVKNGMFSLLLAVQQAQHVHLQSGRVPLTPPYGSWVGSALLNDLAPIFQIERSPAYHSNARC